MSIVESVVVTALAVGVAAFPKLAGMLKGLPLSVVKPKPSAVTYQEAMVALATVRARLVAAGGLSDASGKAIATITQDLVSGSDK